MCGICGICHDSVERPIERPILQEMNDSLIHRGPDGEGLFVEGNIGLGHRRLSIIDLEGGDQPIFNEDRSIAIVFNGEIYNYKEIREQLLKNGHQFKTHSDTEVIVHLYEERGIDCLEALNGMFAFAIWDKNRQRLFIARDRLGEKPLYYTSQNGVFAFGSELKALLRNPDVKTEVNLDALDDFLAYGYVPAPRTIYQNIHKLPPAHFLIWERGEISTIRYWTPHFAPDTTPRSDDDYQAELEALLDDSIRIRLRSDVPVGAFLSGGIDSSLIVALASQQLDKPLETFSIGFSEEDFDESGFARIVAEKYQTNHHELIVDKISLLMFPKLVAHFDEPFADVSSLPTYFVTREASKHLKVCLSGDAGDELFGGYERYRWESHEQQMDRLPNAVRRGVLGPAAGMLGNHVQGKGWLSRMSVSGAERFQRKVGHLEPAERRALFLRKHRSHVDPGAWFFEPHFQYPGLDEQALRMATDQETYLSEDILVKVDRNSMLNSLEVRVPFLDHRLVEFANTLPTSVKIRDGVQKYLLKRMLKDKVPDDIVNRGKKGFGMPLKHWLRGKYYDFTRELLLAPESRSSKFFDQNEIRRLIDAHQKKQRNLADRIWPLLWFEQWCRENNI
ncbi:asparagine synthase (glutamine-hydrolyzing) [endosymbiont of Ridgeia piscesae]|uniref:asparagine synthase (glutamine-hydrolyzing) n=1 Tax=endosymbiont of Ridgeia piscesae TaxID=54398 RepID=A0A0T5Z7B3_9GAMM|nr:asparagine synthase (glutamine-hydrolyzing) [endosymbiont of Ridgeia piscesae]KRT58807.1 asparagine synthase (glutamine-hydrolysing) [endosymbiont of Ridgeia piscesae]